jgi:AcrR family transcriptional regulator
MMAQGGEAAPTKGERTRQAIIEAAIARFGRDGYRATSVADIARDASVGGTVAYAYFPNKEAVFLAAVDEDAAGVIREGASSFIEEVEPKDWREALILTLLAAVEHHPLAKRLLAGLEPEVTARVLETPALADLRKACAQRLRTEQLNGTVRPDLDPVRVANGLVSILLSLLMSVVQVGGDTARTYGPDVAAVLEAAVGMPNTLDAALPG